MSKKMNTVGMIIHYLFNSLFTGAFKAPIISLVEDPEEVDESNPVSEHIPTMIPPKEERVDFHVDKRVRNKYMSGWIKRVRSQKKPITEVVIHGTAGGDTPEGVLQWMYGGERAAEYYKGVALFHYLIGPDGDIVEVLDPDYWVYHSSSWRHDKQTIGIELINSSKTNRRPYTQEQYDALLNLVTKHLMKLYPTLTRITSHRYNSIIYRAKYKKQCPGRGFNWPKFSNLLSGRGFTFKTDGNLHYDIKKVKK